MIGAPGAVLVDERRERGSVHVLVEQTAARTRVSISTGEPPRNHSRNGTLKPRFGACNSSRGSRAPIARRSTCLRCIPGSLTRADTGAISSTSRWSRNGTRASSDRAMLMRSTLVSIWLGSMSLKSNQLSRWNASRAGQPCMASSTNSRAGRTVPAGRAASGRAAPPATTIACE